MVIQLHIYHELNFIYGLIITCYTVRFALCHDKVSMIMYLKDRINKSSIKNNNINNNENNNINYIYNVGYISEEQWICFENKSGGNWTRFVYQSLGYELSIFIVIEATLEYNNKGGTNIDDEASASFVRLTFFASVDLLVIIYGAVYQCSGTTKEIDIDVNNNNNKNNNSNENKSGKLYLCYNIVYYGYQCVYSVCCCCDCYYICLYLIPFDENNQYITGIAIESLQIVGEYSVCASIAIAINSFAKSIFNNNKNTNSHRMDDIIFTKHFIFLKYFKFENINDHFVIVNFGLVYGHYLHNGYFLYY